MLDKIRKWYMDTVPNQRGQLPKFLSKAYTLGHEQIHKYDKTTSSYAIPYKNTGYIPNWTLSNGMFPNTLSNHDCNTLSTAFWNTAILMNHGMVSAKQIPHNSWGAKQEIFKKAGLSFFDFSAYLNRSEQLLNDRKYGMFNQVTLDYTHPKEALVHNYLAWAKQPNVKTLFGVLEHYLNPDLRQAIRKIVGDDLANVLDKIVNADDKNLEMYANQLRELMINDPPQPPTSGQGNENQNEQDREKDSEKQEQTTGDPDQEEENQQGGESNGNQNEQDQAEENQTQKDNTPPMPDDLQDVEPQQMKLENRRISAEMTEALEDLNTALVASWGTEYAGKNLTVSDVMIYEHNSYTIKKSDVFDHLATLIRQIKINKKLPKRADMYGNKLLGKQLSRIKSDRKIFGTNTTKKKKLRKEWVIACDLSGSTSSYNLWLKELSAAKSAFLSLRDAREIVSVYGHTTPTFSFNKTGKGCLVVKIANAQSALIDERFDKAAHVPRVSNYDYLFLDWVVKNGFVHPDSMKIVIILSDGQPVPYPHGIDYMIDSVKLARSKGITVFSVSLVDDVVKNNDKIYGKEYNIDASRGNIDQKLRELFLRMTLEYQEQ